MKDQNRYIELLISAKLTINVNRFLLQSNRIHFSEDGLPIVEVTVELFFVLCDHLTQYMQIFRRFAERIRHDASDCAFAIFRYASTQSLQRDMLCLRGTL
jgi:hypothetical protein